MRSFSTFVLELSRAGILIILVMVLVFLLLGDGSGPYVKSVILNIGEFISIITSEAIIGIAVVLLAWFMVSKIKR